jgi:hypothetical protein
VDGVPGVSEEQHRRDVPSADCRLKEAPSRLTEAGLSDPKSRFFRLYPRMTEQTTRLCMIRG